MGGERFNQGWEHLMKRVRSGMLLVHMTYLWRYAGIYERGQWAFFTWLVNVLAERYKEGQECLIVNEDTELKGR